VYTEKWNIVLEDIMIKYGPIRKAGDNLSISIIVGVGILHIYRAELNTKTHIFNLNDMMMPSHIVKEARIRLNIALLKARDEEDKNIRFLFNFLIV